VLRLLLTLKRIFPKLRWIDSALRSQWDAFWLKQWQEEQRVDPNTASMPPIVGSERAVFIETIASCWPFRSVLEVGCGFGQNAHILHEVLPGIRYVGVDLSSDRVQQASSLLQTIGKNNSMLIEGDVADLSGVSG
jgi:predicted O-methyltransferase YrrM